MPSDKQLNYDNEYCFLRAHYDELRDKFADESIPDDEYFYSGLYFDIVANALNLDLNLSIGNSRSMGLDNNCRAIMEAFAILEMDKQGFVDASQKKMYRYHYAAVEKGNHYKEVNNVSYLDNIEGSDEDLEKLYEIACSYYNCSRQDLIKNKKFYDPYFYLTKSLYEKTNIHSIVGKYGISIDKESYFYDYFSSMLHPRCEFRQDVEDVNFMLHDFLVNYVFQSSLDFLHKELKPISTNKIIKLEDAFKRHPNYLNSLNMLHSICYDVTYAIKQEIGYFVPFYFTTMGYLLTDMLLSKFFELDSLITPKFKSFNEMTSVFVYLLTLDDVNERHYKTSAFIYASRLSLNDFLRKNGSKGFEDNIKQNLLILYDEYFKENYSLNSVDEFIDNLRKNSYYALSSHEDDWSYRSIVKRAIKGLSEKDYDRIWTLYNVSLDTEHGSGYLFNQSYEYEKYFSLETLSVSFNLFSSIIKECELSHNHYGLKVDFESQRKYLLSFAAQFEKEKNSLT